MQCIGSNGIRFGFILALFIFFLQRASRQKQSIIYTGQFRIQQWAWERKLLTARQVHCWWSAVLYMADKWQDLTQRYGQRREKYFPILLNKIKSQTS